ncbi:b(0,+)-type amino acid transporter 1-like isoform X2 [Gigantopelta aegis]|nr:b(0,+)-type amino acid transporter 1-like isoform X2 [Gigantopelta aegis]XP_041376979.1 b(0,+)-type amino acid transporter 1-like isoform X2 [Gigantopelta aegis]
MATEHDGIVTTEDDGMMTTNDDVSVTYESDGGQGVRLQRNVGLVSGTALIVGTMIGSGIFVSPKGVLVGAGSVAMSLVIWGACGILAMFGALVYAELGTAIPKSGGEHAYLMYVFGPMHKVWGPVPTFLFDWLGVFIIRPAQFAVMALSLGTYATQPFYGQCEAPLSTKKIATMLALIVITFINCWSVKAATKVQTFLTASKLLVIVIITVGGIYMMAAGSVAYISEGFEDTKENPTYWAMAFYNGLWAYDGWNNLNFVTEELKNVKRNLPLAILIGIPLTTICYLLVNIGYFSVISKEEMLLSEAVAMMWGRKVIGVMSWIIPIFVVMSCFGSSNGSLFASGRLSYAAAREGHLVQVLSFIDVKRCTPVPSLIFTAIMAAILILPADLSSLIGVFGFTAWIFYGLTAVALLVLRRTEPDLPRPYKVPIVIPIIVVLASLYLIIMPIAQEPQIGFLYVLLFIASGLCVYFPFVYYKVHIHWMDTVTKYIQIFLQVVPPAVQEKRS